MTDDDHGRWWWWTVDVDATSDEQAKIEELSVMMRERDDRIEFLQKMHNLRDEIERLRAAITEHRRHTLEGPVTDEDRTLWEAGGVNDDPHRACDERIAQWEADRPEWHDAWEDEYGNYSTEYDPYGGDRPCQIAVRERPDEAPDEPMFDERGNPRDCWWRCATHGSYESFKPDEPCGEELTGCQWVPDDSGDETVDNPPDARFQGPTADRLREEAAGVSPDWDHIASELVRQGQNPTDLNPFVTDWNDWAEENKAPFVAAVEAVIGPLLAEAQDEIDRLRVAILEHKREVSLALTMDAIHDDNRRLWAVLESVNDDR